MADDAKLRVVVSVERGIVVTEPTKPLESLVEHAGSFAQLMLDNFGEFYPFGCSLDVEGEINTVAACEEEYNPVSQNLIERLREGARHANQAHEITATAVVYDARVQIRDRNIDSDAVVIEVDQSPDDPSIVFMLYQRRSGNIEYGDVLVQPGTGEQYGAR
ncbi:MAG: hypothetical protein AAFX85_17620 [Pseudomonadota bacterium]